jgi:hypothetical protein
MTRFVSILVIAGILALPLGIAAGQAGPPKTVTASVTVTTSDDGRVVAVLSKNEPAFLFCIDLPPRTMQKITYTGSARVVYRPLPLGNIPAGIKIEGPENVASALAVLPSAGKGWLFLGKNEKSVLAAGDAAAAGITTVPASIVRRVDWVASGGQRRGMDVEPCFVSGG